MRVEGWETAKLGDCLEVIIAYGGKTPPKSDAGIPLISAANVKQGALSFEKCEYISHDDYPEWATSGLTYPGDVLITTEAPAGHVAPYPAHGTFQISRRVLALRARQKVLSPGYLLYCLQAPCIQGRLLQLSRGSTVPRVTKEEIINLSLPLPPLPEQHKLAAVLSSVDRAAGMTEAVIVQLGRLKQALMQRLFTRGLPGRHTSFKQTENGEVPEQWKVAALGAVCERVFVGIAKATKHAYVPSGGVPIARTQNIRDNDLDTAKMLRISADFAEQVASKQLRAGDVLTRRTGQPGTSALVPASLDGGHCFTLLVSRPGPELSGQFLVHLMNSPVGRRIVARGKAGGVKNNLNAGFLKQAAVAVPPLDEQEGINDRLNAVYELVSKERLARHYLGRMKATLLADLFSGKVRVKPDEQAE